MTPRLREARTALSRETGWLVYLPLIDRAALGDFFFARSLWKQRQVSPPIES